MAQFFCYNLTSLNINLFSQLFHCQTQEKMCNNTITKDPTTPQVCYTFSPDSDSKIILKIG